LPVFLRILFGNCLAVHLVAAGEGAQMIWFLERESELLICEIRRTEGSEVYEFEVAATDGNAQTHQCTSPTELINHYLRTQVMLQAEGWRPRMNDVDMLA
jgi:hypothetical protein